MADCYTPALAEFKLSAEEEKVIKEALKQADPWNSKDNVELNKIKERIREYHLKRHNDTCCYCRVGLRGRGNFTIDREHILPKKKYKNLTFTMSNLSVSCKRCNMEYKGSKINFIIKPKTIEAAHTDPSRYKLIHPNFDKWEQHLQVFRFQFNKFELVSYKALPGSEKGKYTYKYFRFDRYCIESLDTAQGLKELDEVGRKSLYQLAESLGVKLP